MPVYEHLCTACNNEFEDMYSMTAPVPNACPLCGAEGQVKRLISAVAGRVELSPQEFKANLKTEQTRINKEVRKDEKKLANIVGETKYNEIKVANKKLYDTFKG